MREAVRRGWCPIDCPEIQLLAEFKQLMEYKTFHGRKASDLTYEQMKRAANMINLIEEKVNHGHTDENPVLKGRSVFNGRVQRVRVREGRDGFTNSISRYVFLDQYH